VDAGLKRYTLLSRTEEQRVTALSAPAPPPHELRRAEEEAGYEVVDGRVIAKHDAQPLPSEDERRAEDEGGVEVVDGRLVEKNVSHRSELVGKNVLYELETDARRTGQVAVYGSGLGYKVFPNEPNKSRKPDCSVLLVSRLEDVAVDEGYSYVPADLVVEVVSPNDLDYDVAAKVQEYLAHGFRTVWVVRPNVRTVTVHGSDGTIRVFGEQDEITGDELMPSFRVRVGEFFRLPPQLGRKASRP